MTPEQIRLLTDLRAYLDNCLENEIYNYSTNGSADTREERRAGVEPDSMAESDIPQLEEFISRIDQELLADIH